MKRRIISAVLAIGMILSVTAGCQSNTGTSSAAASSGASGTPSKAAGQTVLKYWYPWGGDSETWDKWRIGEFEKANPDIKVEATYVPEHAGISNGKLMAAIQSGNVPDLVVCDATTPAYALATQGAFEPLDDALKSVGFDESKVNQAEIPLMKWKGVTYIYPQNTDTTLLFYRTDLFQEAGLDPKNPPKTIAELDAAADKLVKKDANGNVTRYGFIPWLDAGLDASTWTWQFGADVYDEANNKVTIANDKVAAVYKWERSYAQKFNPEKMKSFTSSLGAAFSPDHAFMTGKVAMTAIGNWFCNALKQYAPNLKYSVTPLPTISADNYGGCALAGNVFFCPKGAKELTAAMKFCEFCQSSAIIEDNNKNWRSLGIYKDSIQGLSLYKANDPYLKICIDVTFNKNSGQWALSPVTAEMSDKLQALSDQAIYTNDDIMKALTDLQSTLQNDVDTALNQ
jgi:ABC-type sugar transport system, periplasmic component